MKNQNSKLPKFPEPYWRDSAELPPFPKLSKHVNVDVAIVGDSRLQDFIEAAAVFEVAEGHVRGRPAQPDEKFSVSMSHRWTLPAKN